MIYIIIYPMINKILLNWTDKPINSIQLKLGLDLPVCWPHLALCELQLEQDVGWAREVMMRGGAPAHPPAEMGRGWSMEGASARDPHEALESSKELGRGDEGERGEEHGLHGELSRGDSVDFCQKKLNEKNFVCWGSRSIIKINTFHQELQEKTKTKTTKYKIEQTQNKLARISASRR